MNPKTARMAAEEYETMMKVAIDASREFALNVDGEKQPCRACNIVGQGFDIDFDSFQFSQNPSGSVTDVYLETEEGSLHRMVVANPSRIIWDDARNATCPSTPIYFTTKGESSVLLEAINLGKVSVVVGEPLSIPGVANQSRVLRAIAFERGADFNPRMYYPMASDMQLAERFHSKSLGEKLVDALLEFSMRSPNSGL